MLRRWTWHCSPNRARANSKTKKSKKKKQNAKERNSIDFKSVKKVHIYHQKCLCCCDRATKCCDTFKMNWTILQSTGGLGSQSVSPENILAAYPASATHVEKVEKQQKWISVPVAGQSRRCPQWQQLLRNIQQLSSFGGEERKYSSRDATPPPIPRLPEPPL